MSTITVPGYSVSDRIPRVAFALLLGQGSRTPAQSPLDILLVGPRSYDEATGLTPLGVADDNEPQRIYSVDDAIDYWGQKSPIVRMAARVLSSYPGATLWGCSCTKGAGTRGSVTMTVAGTATAAGSVILGVGDKSFEIPVASGASAATVGAAIEAALDADDALPCYPDYAIGVLTLLNPWYGPEQGYELAVLQNVAGITLGSPTPAAGTVACLWDAAFTAAFGGVPSIDYVVPATDVVATLTSGATCLKAQIASALAPTTGLLCAAVVGNTDDTAAGAATMTAAWDDGGTDYSETGYWSQVVWARNYGAEPWCVAAAVAGLRVQAEESSPQLNWIGLQGGPIVPSMVAPWSASDAVLSDSVLNAALLAGVTPIKYEWDVEKSHVVLSITAKHQIGSVANATMLENTNVPAVCRAVSYGIRTSLALAFSGFAIVSDVDGEAPDDLPSRTTSPQLVKEFLVATMKTDYEARAWVKKVEAHRDVTGVEQDSDNPSRLLYELPMDVPRWVTQIVGVHRALGGTG